MSTALVRSEKQPIVGYILLLGGFFGLFGLHRLYAGRRVSGVVWLLTFGLCGIGQFVDIFFIPRMIRDHNDGRPVW